MDLIKKSNIVIIHYGCSDFKKIERTIFWIGAISFIDNEKSYFFENGDELEILEKFKIFLENHQSSTFLHWGMDRQTFGFSAIQKRYEELTGKAVSFIPSNLRCLSEYLKNKYGVDYVSRKDGRLNNLARLNGFSGFQKTVEVKEVFEASQRLELIFSIYQAECQGRLKIDRTSVFNNNMWNKKCYALFEYLVDNYHTNKKVQLTSIWFYLYELESEIYVINCTKEVYKNYIKTYYNLEIRNFDKPSNWQKVKTILKDFQTNFGNM